MNKENGIIVMDKVLEALRTGTEMKEIINMLKEFRAKFGAEIVESAMIHLRNSSKVQLRRYIKVNY